LIVSNAETFGISVENYDQELAYDRVNVQGRLSLEAAARLAGTNEATLRALNPSLLRSSLPPGEQPFALKLPYGSARTFLAALGRQAPVDGPAAAGEYQVQAGDTLGRIAQTHKVKLHDLMAANDLANDVILVGQSLLIPGAGGVPAQVTVKGAPASVAYGPARMQPIRLREEFQLVEQTGSTADEPLFAVSLTLSPASNDSVPTVYKVRGGDTLSALAQRFKVAVADIRRWNKLDGNL